ncbi:hypothetical protein GM3709_1184 [Geminocystis sp. NIES-3709]|nr:hypothetical protein GM3709_1184 [Geminocystis sp. NIES-3709]
MLIGQNWDNSEILNLTSNGNKSIIYSFESIIITFPYSLFPFPSFYQ